MLFHYIIFRSDCQELWKFLRDKALHIPPEIGKHNPLSPEETVTLYRLLYKMLGKEDVRIPEWDFSQGQEG